MNNSPSSSRLEQKAAQLWQKYLTHNITRKSTNNCFWKDYQQLIQDSKKSNDVSSVISPKPTVTSSKDLIPVPVHFRNSYTRKMMVAVGSAVFMFGVISLTIWAGKARDNTTLAFRILEIGSIVFASLLYTLFSLSEMKVSVLSDALIVKRHRFLWEHIGQISITPIHRYKPHILIIMNNGSSREFILQFKDSINQQLLALIKQIIGDKLVINTVEIPFQERFKHL